MIISYSVHRDVSSPWHTFLGSGPLDSHSVRHFEPGWTKGVCYRVGGYIILTLDTVRQMICR